MTDERKDGLEMIHEASAAASPVRDPAAGSGAPSSASTTTDAVLREALGRAVRFIENGIKHGYVRLPDPPDTAGLTLPFLRAALATPAPQPSTPWNDAQQSSTVERFVESYEFRGDTDHTPTEDERAMLADAIHGYLFELQEHGLAPQNKATPAAQGGVRKGWDIYYEDAPSDLKRRLSLHDFKRLGDLFKAAFPERRPAAQGDAEPVAARIWQDIIDNNPSDVTSPEEYPDHALITFDEVFTMMKQFQHDAAPRPASATTDAECLDWLQRQVLHVYTPRDGGGCGVCTVSHGHTGMTPRDLRAAINAAMAYQAAGGAS